MASLERILGELWYRPQPGRAAAKNVVDVDEWDMMGWVDLEFICLIPFLGSFGLRLSDGLREKLQDVMEGAILQLACCLSSLLDGIC